MTSECLLCGDRSDKRFTISNVIKVLHSVISALEVKSKEESIYEAQATALCHQVKELSAGSESLKEEKTKAEKRAELYKLRFLDAQKTIKLLHEKNVQLSNSQKKPFIKPPSHFLFESPATSISRVSDAANEPVLAPDTCGFDLVKRSPISCCISSDEEDFQEPQSRNSPKASKIVQKLKKNTIESYFIVPKSPAKQRKAETTVDFDETRLDVGGSMDFSASLTDSELEKWNEEMDSIPPSPVLTSHRLRLSSRKSDKWQKCKPTVLRPTDRTNRIDLEETFITEKPSTRINMLSNGPVIDLNMNSVVNMVIPDPALKQIGLKLICGAQIEPSDKGNHTLVTQKNLKPDPSAKPLIVPNTSLDEIFDTTDGDLETTSMLLGDSCNNTVADEYDEDIDQFLLEDENGRQNLTQMPPSCKIQRSNSFDAPPKKEIVFKPNEVVRKKDEREKLESRSCPQCDTYYSDLPASQRKIALKKFCRHKIVNSPPSTPDNFWEVDIPSTAECIRRGYITDKTLESDTEKQGVHAFRRKRPLQPFHGKKDLS